VVKDTVIIKLVERIGEHYRTNIANRFIRPALLQLPLEKQTWDTVESFTAKVEQYRYLDELYHQIIAAAQFVAIVRRDLAPVLRYRVQGALTGQDKVFRDMAVHNFSSNIKVFADLVNDLFVQLVEIDKARVSGRGPVYTTIRGLEDVGRLLVGS